MLYIFICIYLHGDIDASQAGWKDLVREVCEDPKAYFPCAVLFPCPGGDSKLSGSESWPAGSQGELLNEECDR